MYIVESIQSSQATVSISDVSLSSLNKAVEQ